MKKSVSLYSSFFFAGTACLACMLTDAKAQVTVVTENAFTTDSVDLFTERQGPKRSPTLSMAASLLLPGSGHQYLERNRSALAYFSADALAFFAFFFVNIGIGERYLYPIFFLLIDRVDIMLVIVTSLFSLSVLNMFAANLTSLKSKFG